MVCQDEARHRIHSKVMMLRSADDDDVSEGGPVPRSTSKSIARQPTYTLPV